MKSFLLSLLIVLLLLIGGAVLFVYSGLYSTAATDEHSGLEEWALQTAKRRYVERAAADLEAPPFSREDKIHGAGSYAAMCATCHGAPGARPSVIGQGLNPAAPEPARLARDWSPEQTFWIVKNGIRMTGMPAWGATHTDGQLWEIVAFVADLEEMTPEQYAAMVEEAPEHDHDGDAGPDRQPSEPGSSSDDHHHDGDDDHAH